MDVVTLQGGSTPALTDDELEAVLSGSVPEKDLLPPVVQYEWFRDTQSFDNPRGAQYTVVSNDAGKRLAVTAQLSDDLGEVLVFPELQASRQVSNNTTVPDGWSISLTPQASPLYVGQRLDVAHRPIDTSLESVSYEWFRLETVSGWKTADSIGTLRSYSVTEDDIGSYIGVRAILTFNNEKYDADVVSSSTAMMAPSGNTYSLDATILPLSLYLDSELDYTYSVLRNGSVIDVDPSQLSVEWY
ncbi:hypothetical protein UB34_20800, partial [Photobacterium leiognathi]